MKRVFNAIIERLSDASGYDYDFLVDRYNEMVNETGDCDLDDFATITMEHDW